MDGFDRARGLGLLLADTLLSFESTAFSGFGLFLSVSFHRGQGAFLRLQGVVRRGEGNHTPVEAEMRRDEMRRHKRVYK